MKRRAVKLAAAASAAALALSLGACAAGDDGFDPSDNDIEDVYGPPLIEEYDPDDGPIEALYGPPEDFDIETVEVD